MLLHRKDESISMNYLQLIIDFFFIFFPIAFVLRHCRHSGNKLLCALEELGFKKMAWKPLLRKTVLLFAAIFFIGFAISFAADMLAVNDLEKVAEAVEFIPKLPLFAYAFVMVVKPVGEEMFFRGLLVPRIGVIAATVVFAAMHALYFSVIEVIGAFVLGFVLAYAFKRNRNLLPNIAAHIAYNAVVFSII